MLRIVITILVWGLAAYVLGVPASASLPGVVSFEQGVSIVTLTVMLVYGGLVWRVYAKTSIPLSKLGAVIALGLLAVGALFVEADSEAGVMGVILFGSLALGFLRERVPDDKPLKVSKALIAALAALLALGTVLLPALLYLGHGVELGSKDGAGITIGMMLSMVCSIAIAGFIYITDTLDAMRSELKPDG